MNKYIKIINKMKHKVILVLLIIFLIPLIGALSIRVDVTPEVEKEVVFIGPPAEIISEQVTEIKIGEVEVIIQDTNKVLKSSSSKKSKKEKSSEYNNKRLYEQKTYNEDLKKQIDKLESIQKDTIK